MTFEFDHPILSKREFAELPPNTIIATGPYTEMFSLMNIPNEMAYGYVARGVLKENGERSKKRFCLAYFDYYNKDYASHQSGRQRLILRPAFLAFPGRRRADERLGETVEGARGPGLHLQGPKQGPFRSRYPNSPTLFSATRSWPGPSRAPRIRYALPGCTGPWFPAKSRPSPWRIKELPDEMFKSPIAA